MHLVKFLWLNSWMCFYGSSAGSRGTTSITDVCTICLSIVYRGTAEGSVKLL